MKGTGLILSFLLGMFAVILGDLLLFPLWMELNGLQPVADRLREGGHSGAVSFSLIVSAHLPTLAVAFVLGLLLGWTVRNALFAVLLCAGAGLLLGPALFQWIAFEHSPSAVVGALTVSHVLVWWGVALLFLALGAGCARKLGQKKGGSSS